MLHGIWGRNLSITGITYVFYIKKLLHKMYGTTLEVKPELPGNLEYTFVQSRPLLVSEKSSTLRRALIVLIAKLTGIFAGLAFPMFCCLPLELLLTQGEGGEFHWEVSKSPLLIEEMEISSHRQNT